jgi:hypothetical protein
VRRSVDDDVLVGSHELFKMIVDVWSGVSHEVEWTPVPDQIRPRSRRSLLVGIDQQRPSALS